jgi:arylsulfatase A-like enzyme
MGDGVRPDELGIGGNRLIQTPHIDRIGREGIQFTNGFAINALCAPSRGTILTGLYPCKHGVIDNFHQLKPGIPIISDLLRSSGYEVALCGKSHQANGLRDHYWDYYYAYLKQQPYFGASIAEGFNGQIGEDKVIEGYADDVITDHAVHWLGSRSDTPFCLFLWLKAPHDPYMLPRRLATLYDDGSRITKPATFDDDIKGYPGKPRAFAHADLKIGTDKHHIPTLEALVKSHYAGTMGLDDNVGRVWRALESSGKLDNTVFMFSSDHGYFLGEWHFLNKQLMHEPSIRIPLLIRYPRAIKPETVNREMVLNLDLGPTILDIAGVKVPQYMQGQSLVPFLRGRSPGNEWRKDWLYTYYQTPDAPKNRGVRTDRYKIIEYWDETPREYELYDLQEDPLERNNLFGDPAYSGLQGHLLQRLVELRREMGEV